MKKNIIGIILLIILIILSFIGISSTLYSKPNLPNDTIIVIPKVQDTVVNINGKYGTFIGDSHTSNIRVLIIVLFMVVPTICSQNQ